ncbi:Bro-N domain-containing protein [Phocaeicola plebeius]|jgi:prophage antirepressor-like protein|uniref:BRO-N domain-containing protein n=1 Tax=Phocaeicola plebeius TaxID=310297 RepID=UPI003520ED89
MDNANIRQTTGLQVFYNENENVNVRTQVINDEPWFVAKDVAMALNITWSGHTLDNIPNEWTQMVKLTINGSDGGVSDIRRMTLINEAAVYKLAFRSNKPEADRFVNWVTGTVLPSIRRTGSYSVSGERPESTKRLPLPKFRPYFGQWKENVKPYISRAELCLTAEKQRVTLGHVQKVYAGTAMSYPVAKCIQYLAKKNRQEGRNYPEKKPAYEQLCITWEE